MRSEVLSRSIEFYVSCFNCIGTRRGVTKVVGVARSPKMI